jgi:acetyltransferase
MDITQPPRLPHIFETPDGRRLTIRRIRSSDAPLLAEMFHHLSQRSRRLRFHAYSANLPEERIWREAVALSDLDPARQAALVALDPDADGEHIVGVARLARASAEASDAEAAVVVCDAYQRLGLGTHLLGLLLPVAYGMGIRRLFGWVMSENRHMLGIVKKTDLPVKAEPHSGEMFVTVTLEPRPDKRDRDNRSA